MVVMSDAWLVDALRRGDERVFAELVRSWGSSMLRVALLYVPSHAVAEEVVQEAWVGVLRGIERFERRSSLKTCVFRILVNTAKTRGERERRAVPFSSLEGDDTLVDVGPPGATPTGAVSRQSSQDKRRKRSAGASSMDGEGRAISGVAGLTCQELVELVTDYLEGALDDATRTRFDEHLEACSACRAYLEQMGVVLRAVGRLREDDLEPAATETLLHAFRDWKHDGG